MSDVGTPARGRRPQTHYEQVKRELELLAGQLAAQGESRFPAEDQLARETGFSRPTVRSALLAMQMEGKLLRSHGVGTFINRHALMVQANLAEDLAFLTVIAQLGYEPSLDIVSVEQRALPPAVSRRLDRPAGTIGIVIDRVFGASGRAAVASRDYVPIDRLTVAIDDVVAEGSTFAFIRRWTTSSVRYSVARIRALLPPPTVAAILGTTADEPVLLLDHLHIDADDEAIGVTEAYVRDDIIGFSVVRTGSEL